MFIYHKSEAGCVDMTIAGAANKIALFEQAFAGASLDLSKKGMSWVKTGKSAAIRIKVPCLDFTKPFENYSKDIPTCFEAVAKMTTLAKEVSQYKNIVELINS